MLFHASRLQAVFPEHGNVGLSLRKKRMYQVSKSLLGRENREFIPRHGAQVTQTKQAQVLRNCRWL